MRALHKILIGASLIALPAVAQAETNGWYAGVAAGWNQTRDGDISGTGINHSTSYDHGWAGLANLGYGFGQIRVEGELGYRQNDVDKVGGVASGGDVSSWSVMGNVLYDFPVDFVVKPYIGAGIGGAHVDFDGVTRNGAFLDDSDTVFAYQGIVGAGIDLTSQWRLNLDYRYFATLDAGVTTKQNQGVDAEYSNHTVMLGIVYKFGAPAPKPVVQPAAAPAPAPAAPTPPPAPKAAAPAPAPKSFLVFFDWDKAEITKEARAIIEQAAVAAKSGNLARIDLTGHADRSGTDKYNMKLSVKRADAVKAELLKLGVPAAQISTIGKGESQPLVATADGVREPQNRRVEIVLPQ